MKVVPAFIIRLILIVLPLYLVFGFLYLKKEALLLAITYHLFLIINGILTIVYYLNENLIIRPLLEISLKPEYKPVGGISLFGPSFHTYLVQILGVIIGFFIIIYLLAKRKIFKNH